jgi:multisubunit Na+/H+ antiporter MnhB subunit
VPITYEGYSTRKIAMKKIHSFPLEASIHPISLEFSDNLLEREYQEDSFRSDKLIAQIALVLGMALLGLFLFPAPHGNLINGLIYSAAPILFALGTGYILERRQRIAFLKRMEEEQPKVHIVQALAKHSQEDSSRSLFGEVWLGD